MDFQRAKEFREILENAPFWKKGRGAPFSAGKFLPGERTRKNWSGCLPFYLFGVGLRGTFLRLSARLP